MSCDAFIMQQHKLYTQDSEPTLVGMKTALELIFPDKTARPSPRAFAEWKAKKYFSSIKIGKRVWIDPVKAKKELEARFTIKANG